MTRPDRFRIPAQIALAALVAYGAGFWFTSFFPGYLPKIGALWSAISAIVVTQVTRKETTASASCGCWARRSGRSPAPPT